MTLFFNTNNSDMVLHRRLRYLRFIYLTSASMILFYFFKYNFEYKLYFFNWLFIPSFTLLLMAPLSYKFNGQFITASILTLSASTLVTTILIWTCGGLDAPGLIWLASIPFTYAILLGRGAAIGGTLLVGAFLTATFVAKRNGVTFDYLAEVVNIDSEKILNTLLFTLYSVTAILFFIKSERDYQQELQSQKEEIDNLLKILIHDVGNPLTILGLTVSSINSESSLEIAKTKKTLLKVMGNMRLLLNQVKSLRALNDGKTVIKLLPTDLTAMIEDLRLELKPRFDLKELKLKIDLQHQHHFVLADENLLRQVILMNLLTNALKFSEPGNVIEIITRNHGDKVSVDVRDYGIGIPESLRDSIFNPYEAATRPGTCGESGTGFGLPLTKDFVKKFNGSIELISSEKDTEHFKRGSCFRIWLNTAPTENDLTVVDSVSTESLCGN